MNAGRPGAAGSRVEVAACARAATEGPCRTVARGLRTSSIPLCALILVLTGLGSSGCGPDSSPAAPAQAGDELLPGIEYSADLDGDAAREELLLDSASATLVITDEEVVYRSREQWHIAQAAVGDTDGNGLLEVVALLDAVDGRHLGLFAYFGGQYGERLVTQPLRPEPLALRVLPRDNGAVTPGEKGDLLVLEERTNKDHAGGSTSVSTLYRWNGFGFTAIGQL